MGNAFTGATATGYSNNLLYVRTQFIDQSGRFDLVVDAENDDYDDNGANYFINSAQRRLNRLLNYPTGSGWLFKVMSDGQALVTFNRARYVREVWGAVDSDNNRWKLERKPYAWLQEQYATVPLSSVDTGQPLYWSPLVINLAPEQFSTSESTLETAGATDLDLIYFDNHYPYSGIVVYPPADDTYTLRLLAEWRENTLVNDTDVSFWTYAEPSILVRATRREIEVDLHRNMEGAKGFDEGLVGEVRGIYHDLIAEDMQGSPDQFYIGG